LKLTEIIMAFPDPSKFESFGVGTIIIGTGGLGSGAGGWVAGSLVLADSQSSDSKFGSARDNIMTFKSTKKRKRDV
jgi:hypothetical protein